MSSEQKPKFRVGQLAWCTICGVKVKLLKKLPDGTFLASPCCPRGESGIDPNTQLRPLTKRERGEGSDGQQ